VRALLDTHSFLWFVGGDARLSASARQVIEDLGNEIFISTASLWEIAIKVNLGKLDLGAPYEQFIPAELQRQKIAVFPIEVSHLSEVAKLPLHHRDPFDRLIIAQALTEGMPIISVDEVLDDYGVQRIWKSSSGLS
jgi:PIN domain nuclease of toxin-antitoxin system